jgi:pimeloyl-ACP methyl ester carboxylesterase
MRIRAISLTLLTVAALGVLPLPAARVSAAVATRQVAAGKFATAADQLFTADGVTLRYREIGTGSPVVLIHGYSASLESLTPLADALASSHRVVAFDVRGFGKSSKFSDAARFGPAMVDDVVRLLDHLQIPRTHLIGHSMGALIAAHVVAKYPARVASVALVAAPFYADKATFTKEVTPWLADLESGKGLSGFLQWLLPKAEPAAVAAFNAQALKGNDLPSLIAVMRSLPELAIGGLPSQKTPTLVAVGTADPLHPLSPAFARSSNGARLMELEGADHINVLGRPELMRAIGELLKTPTTMMR